MSNFSDLLKFFSDRAGIGAPQIAGYCNMDRVTVYRFIKGKSLPKNKETVFRIADVLQLTMDERNDLVESYDCAKLGTHAYRERHYIRSFIKSFSGMAPMTPFIEYDARGIEDTQGNVLIESGRNNNVKIIQKEVLRECQRDDCEIKLIMRSNNNVIMDMLFSAGKRNKNLKIKHLIPITGNLYSGNNGSSVFQKEKYIEHDTGINELLKNFFKVIRMCAEEFEYEPSYYYSRQEEIGKFPVYSNLLITEGAAILFTDDLSESILLSATDQVSLFKEKYKLLASDKPKLIYVFKDLESLLDNTNKVVFSQKNRAEEEYYYSSLPCLIPILTNEIINSHLCKRIIPGNKKKDNDIIIKIRKYVDMVRARDLDCGANINLFITVSGIRYFKKTGRFAEVPPEVYFPIDEETRKKMILELSESFPLKCRFLKSELSAPEGMLSVEVLNDSLFLVFYVLGKGMCFFDINEPGILLAFRNFFKGFSDEDFFSEEESKKILRQIAMESL